MTAIVWFKAFHVVFVVTWFAGLFYLPRLLVYHAETVEAAIRGRFTIMERRLLTMTHIGGGLTVLSGLGTLAAWQRVAPDYFAQAHWLQVKLALVLLLIVYHALLARLVRAFARDACRWSPRALRWFNEIPGVLLLAIVILAIVKRF